MCHGSLDAGCASRRVLVNDEATGPSVLEGKVDGRVKLDASHGLDNGPRRNSNNESMTTQITFQVIPSIIPSLAIANIGRHKRLIFICKYTQ